LQVRDFVADNARTLLGGDSVSVLTVSARLALTAKLACGSDDSGGVLSTVDVDTTLEEDPRWAASQFGTLESFMLDFLTGGEGESTRLKLQTPVYVAAALLDAAQVQLDAELTVAEQEVRPLVCMYINFYISTASAWILTTPDLDKICKASNVAGRMRVVVTANLSMLVGVCMKTCMLYTPRDADARLRRGRAAGRCSGAAGRRADRR
jgi:hypothetical protein